MIFRSLRTAYFLPVLFLFINLSFAGEVLKYQWQAGTNYIYQVKLNDRVNSSLSGINAVNQTKNSSELNLLQLNADLIMHCYGFSEDNGYRFGLRFVNIRDLNIQFQGETLVDQTKVTALLSNARELLVDYDNTGRVLKIRHFLDHDPLLTRIIAVISGELQVALTDDNSTLNRWKSNEVDYIGQGIADYALLNSEDGISYLDKTKNDYQQIYTIPEGNHIIQIDADYKIEFNEKGYLNHITGIKALSARKKNVLNLSVKTDFEARLIKITEDKTLNYYDNSSLVDYDYKMVQQTKRAKLNSLKQSAANLNPVTFFSWAEQYSQQSVKNSRDTFMMKSRMASLVELHPELTASFEKKILSDRINIETKEMLLSVLVNTGTIQAQNSIMRVLNHNDMKVLPDYYSLLQVSTFLQKPVNIELINFYMDMMENDNDQNIRMASMYTCGALIRNLKDHHLKDLAGKYNKRLVGQLNTTKPYKEQYALMFAIRNTQLPENFLIIKPYLKSENELVRRGAVRAMGKYSTSEASYLLLEALSDKSANVKNGAIQSLSEQNLVRSDLEIIKQKVINGDLDQPVDVTLIGLMMKSAKKFPNISRQILQAIDARGLGNEETEYKVRSLIKALSVTSP